MDQIAAIDRLLEVRRETERITSPLAVDDYVVQSMPDVSPPKWHLAHTTWFFDTFVLRRSPSNPAYTFLFNSYYDAVGERVARARRGTLSRPTLEEVRAYRRSVDDALAVASGLDLAAVELGMNHEQQHQELLYTDIKHILGTAPMKAPYVEGFERAQRAEPLAWHPEPGGVREIGHAGPGFSYDNERPRHHVFVEPFALATRPVTCGEWSAFIEDGGYTRHALWLSEGWAAVCLEGWQAPLYWEKGGRSFRAYTLGGVRDLDPEEPVAHVSYYEADAYARWAGARLPTEAEWEVAASSGALPFVGAVWEWTASAYLPYPGFRPLEGAFGEYNGKFMVNQMVLRGGSRFTPRGHARTTYRNFFPPGARWQLSGVRLARGAG